MEQWKEKWAVLKELPAGGQGKTYLVAEHGTIEPQFFLKELHKDRDRNERRARFHREVSCYETLKHPQIPALIDSNKTLFDNKNIVPYLVSEFINGANLHKYVQQSRGGFLPAAEAIKVTYRLLEVLQYAHQQDTVHRDIKPDNIIIRNNDPSDPVLVDFGMAFYEGEDQLTPRAQQIGNRFLRLPEFSPGNSDKRSHRSDITLCAGILFFMLTGIMPRELRDENGHAPHQTPVGREAFLKHKDIDLMALKSIFDRAFEQKIHARWDSASSLAEALKKIAIGNNIMNEEQTPEKMIARIRAQMESHEEERIRQISNFLEQAYKILNTTLSNVARELSGFSTSGGDNRVDTSQQKRTGMVGLVKSSDTHVGYTPRYSIELQGEEVVININSEIIFRGMSTNIEKDATKIAEIFRKNLLTGVTKLLVPIGH